MLTKIIIINKKLNNYNLQYNLEFIIEINSYGSLDVPLIFQVLL